MYVSEPRVGHGIEVEGFVPIPLEQLRISLDVRISFRASTVS
jgi:hypothetical protein